MTSQTVDFYYQIKMSHKEINIKIFKMYQINITDEIKACKHAI